MKVFQESIEVATRGPGLYDITAGVASIVRRSEVQTGLCSVFIQHTSASLVIQENASPAVHRDLLQWLARMAPEGSHYEHDEEGPDDMPAHLKCAITRTSESVPVQSGNLALGTWQGLYVIEHRRAANRRRLVVTVMGV